MKLTQQSRAHIRLQNLFFLILFLSVVGMLAWLSQRYHFEFDWTAGQRNTLSEATQKLLTQLDQPLSVTVFIEDNPELEQSIKDHIANYRRFKKDITLEFVNPDLEPERAQREGVTYAGQVVLRMNARHEVINELGEQAVANALQRLSRGGERRLLFLEGHGERAIQGTETRDYEQIVSLLGRSGFTVQTLNLIRTPAIPENISALVIAAPRKHLLEGEVKLIRDYVAHGGNLLWLQDPGKDLQGLKPLAADLGLHFIDGVVVDANKDLRALLGAEHPAIIPVVDYPRHAVTRDIEAATLFPLSRALETDREQAQTDWRQEPILMTMQGTWSEVGDMESGDIVFEADKGDREGPLALGMSLTRKQGEGEQRLMVLGNANFMANGFLGTGGNLELAMNIFNWLGKDDKLISIATKGAPDTQLNLSDGILYAIAGFFLFLLPIGLIGAGVWVWLRRRKR